MKFSYLFTDVHLCMSGDTNILNAKTAFTGGLWHSCPFDLEDIYPWHVGVPSVCGVPLCSALHAADVLPAVSSVP